MIFNEHLMCIPTCLHCRSVVNQHLPFDSKFSALLHVATRMTITLCNYNYQLTFVCSCHFHVPKTSCLSLSQSVSVSHILVFFSVAGISFLFFNACNCALRSASRCWNSRFSAAVGAALEGAGATTAAETGGSGCGAFFMGLPRFLLCCCAGGGGGWTWSSSSFANISWSACQNNKNIHIKIVFLIIGKSFRQLS